uniref:Large ribosomal subunit protein mL53 n=1 Tax=Maconellicoccus hirsutus TaxID=177089 RepID=A2I437_MACHI|nr:hypothetical protein [Maconellicoccus hirsutus]
MALKYTGTGTRSGGIYHAIKKQLDLLNLEPAKRITFQFDPFGDNALSMRHFLFIINGKQAWKTNPNCRIKTEIVCDRREPTIDVALNNGESILFKCRHFDHLDMIKLFNKYITVLAPKPVEVTPTAIQSKIIRKSAKK